MQIRSLSQTTFVTQRTSTVTIYLSLVDFSSRIACGIIQIIISPHPSAGTASNFTLLILQSPPPTASGYFIYSHVVLYDIVCPLLWVCDSWLINHCLSHLSGVKYYIFGHPHKPRAEILLSLMGWIGGKTHSWR